MARISRCIAVTLALVGTLPADGIEFADAPRAAVVDNAVRISFAAQAACDATVAVIDRDGRIVRHLASGVLGPNAPAPFKKDALAQEVAWDRTDDAGKPVPEGEYSVRVGLGLSPTFDRQLGYNPYRLGTVRAIAAGPDGNIYVFHAGGNLHPMDGTTQCAVFGRDGKYLRTILPYPADLPEDKLAGLRRIEAGADRGRNRSVRLPFIYQVETRSLVPGAGELPSHRAIVTRDGRLAFCGIQELGRYAGSGPARLTVIGTDGSVPVSPLGPQLANSTQSGLSLALSPDEKTIYATGAAEKKIAHAVYKMTWSSADALPFIGTPGIAGSDETHLNHPMAVAVNKAGRIYVADSGNNRIVVAEPDGKFVASSRVPNPQQIEVHPTTGAVYVLGGKNKEMLYKFDAEWRQVAHVRLGYFAREAFSPVMALDASAEPPLVWVGSSHGLQFCRYGLLRIEDRGEQFGDVREITTQQPEQPSVGPVLDIGLDRATERLYVGSRGFATCLDGRSGKRLDFKPDPQGGSGRTATVGRDGCLYSYWDYPDASLSRFDLAGRPIPFAATGAMSITNLGSPRLRGRGLDVTADGNIYALVQKSLDAGSMNDAPGAAAKPARKDPAGDASDANALNVYGPDGVLKKARLIDSSIRSLSSVRVDREGNIYLILGLRPGKDPLPPGLNDVPTGKSSPDSVKGVNYYPLLYGSLARFSPAGGEIRPGVGGTACTFGYANAIDVKGSAWITPGVSPAPSWRTEGTPDVCLCESPRFDLDEFGRSFFPDAGRFRAGVLDRNGNVVCWFGTYGNRDAAGLGFTWPYAVAVGDEAVYVADRIACRVVRAKLTYAAEKTVAVPSK